MQKVAVAIQREILETINQTENTVRAPPIVKRRVVQKHDKIIEKATKENEQTTISFPNLRPKTRDSLDTLIHDVTIARNWYHEDTIQQLVNKLAELNNPNQTQATDTSYDSIKIQHRKESKLKPLNRKVLNSHKQAVRMPSLDSQKQESQGELKVVITQTSPENESTPNKKQEAHYKNNKADPELTKTRVNRTHVNTDSIKTLNTKAQSIASSRHQFVRFSDNASFVSGTTAENQEAHLNSLSSKVRLPILGKRFTNQRHKATGRTLLSDVRRVTHGLYGDNFDVASSGHFTYKKQRGDVTPRGTQPPMHHVTPTLEENLTGLVSKSLAMYQSKNPSPNVPMTSRVTSNKKIKRSSIVEFTPGPQLNLQDPPNTAYQNLVEYIGDHEASQRRLFRHQVAQENVRMFEKDYFYRSFNEIEKPEFGEWLRMYSETNEKETPIKIVRSAILPFTDVPADDIDVTIVPVDGELELRLENKRHRAVERRRRLREIKTRHLAKSRNTHLAVVENKLAPLKTEINKAEKKYTAPQDAANKTKDKKAMPTKVYKIFGERAKNKTTNTEKLK